MINKISKNQSCENMSVRNKSVNALNPIYLSEKDVDILGRDILNINYLLYFRVSTSPILCFLIL